MSEIQQKDISTLDELVTNLEQKAIQFNESNSKLEETLIEKTLLIKDLENTFLKDKKRFEDEIIHKESEITALNQTLNNLQDKKLTIADNISKLNEEYEFSSNALSDVSQEVIESEKRLAILQREKELAQIIPEIKIKEGLVIEVKILEGNIEVAKAQISRLSKEKNNLEEDLSILKPSLEQSRLEQSNLRENISQLRKEIKSTQDLILENKSTFSQEKEILLSKNAELKSENELLKKENLQIIENNKKKLEDLTKKEEILQKREEASVFQVNDLAIKEKKLRQREEALGIKLEINQ
jgi:hypothetical protein